MSCQAFLPEHIGQEGLQEFSLTSRPRYGNSIDGLPARPAVIPMMSTTVF